MWCVQSITHSHTHTHTHNTLASLGGDYEDDQGDMQGPSLAGV
jgi:hypothetical protein